MEQEKKEWFESWFDSPYHQLLYRNRNTEEAHALVDRLFDFLNIKPECKILDIACGDGRHAYYMQQKGHDVTGIDLSEQRIGRALTLANDKLHFYRHDMRNVFRANYYDYAFNFFTSFGYFQQYRDNIIAADAFSKALKPGGKLVLDYMNIEVVAAQLVPAEQKVVDGISFGIRRYMEGNKVVKEITVTDKEGRVRQHEERVSGFGLEAFQEIFADSGLKITHVFGDYALNAFDKHSSPRLIMVFEKK
jgi:SAM-dependent methyltransferase